MEQVNICILGAGGQLGSKLLNKFSQNENIKIFAVDKVFNNELVEKKIEYLNIDLKKESLDLLLKLPNKEIKFINCIGIQHSFFSRKILDINSKLNKKILNFLNNNFTDFHYIYISSLSVDNNISSEPIPGRGSPINYYGKSKLSHEKYLIENIQKPNLTTIIRPAAFYDKKLSKNLEVFFDLLMNKVFVLPSKEMKRSFLSLDYFSELMEKYILSNMNYEIFEVGDKKPIDFKYLFDYFEQNGIKTKSKIIYLPVFLFTLAGRVGYFIEHLGIHISLLTILGEFGYNFVSKHKDFNLKLIQEDTYENFVEIFN